MKINGKNTYSDGSTIWYKNGKTHRDDGPAVMHSDGRSVWYKKGKLHREDGPAIEWYSGYKEWHINGKRHRIDGPAVEGGGVPFGWWVNNVRSSSYDNFQDLTGHSDEYIMYLKLKYGEIKND